jgi:hypothetical protein
LLEICFAPSLADSFLFLTLTRLVVVFIFVKFSFALFTPPLGDYQGASAKREIETGGDKSASSGRTHSREPAHKHKEESSFSIKS